MDSELPRFITACCHYTPSAAAPDDQGLASELFIAPALYRDKKSIQIEVYDVPFHASN
jgi:hypothetical protein